MSHQRSRYARLMVCMFSAEQTKGCGDEVALARWGPCEWHKTECCPVSTGIFTSCKIILSLKYSYHLKKKCGPEPRFTNGFSIAIQIRWKFRFTLIAILIQWSLQNFVHGTTAELSWHVQTFFAFWWPATELQQGEVSIEFELRVKNR